MRRVRSKSQQKLDTRPEQPAYTPEEREQQMMGYAMDLAEKQLREGTASTQVIVHFLRLASSRENLEKEYLEERKALLQKKTEVLESQKRVEELYKDALDAMRSYSGSNSSDGDKHG